MGGKKCSLRAQSIKIREGRRFGGGGGGGEGGCLDVTAQTILIMAVSCAEMDVSLLPQDGVLRGAGRERGRERERERERKS